MVPWRRPSLQAAVFRAVYTEVNARVQQAAMSHGRPIAALDAEEGRSRMVQHDGRDARLGPVAAVGEILANH